jgi:predicted nucleic acid-binding Zn ribbon protein
MHCPQCSKSILSGSAFCSHCGRSTASVTVAALVEAKRTNGFEVIWKIFVAVAIVVGAVFPFIRISSNANKSQLGSDNLAKSVMAVRVPVTRKIFRGQMVVQAGQVGTLIFTISPQMACAELIGTFRASGGAGNDIKAIVADEAEFETWKNGHEAKTYSSTEPTTKGKFDVALGPGTYIIRFSNTFGLLSPKEVTAEIELHYPR